MYLMLEEGESDGLCESLRSHLEVCPSCAERFRGLKGLVGLCRRFPEEEIPENRRRKMKEKILKALAESGRS